MLNYKALPVKWRGQSGCLRNFFPVISYWPVGDYIAGQSLRRSKGEGAGSKRGDMILDHANATGIHLCPLPHPKTYLPSRPTTHPNTVLLESVQPKIHSGGGGAKLLLDCSTCDWPNSSAAFIPLLDFLQQQNACSIVIFKKGSQDWAICGIKDSSL